MTDLKTTHLKVDHVYRVVGPTLQNGKTGREKERFEALRYVGMMVPYRNEVADVYTQIEAFYSFAKRHYVLFRSGTFEAEELLQ